jgi:hypothetical protein
LTSPALEAEKPLSSSLLVQVQTALLSMASQRVMRVAIQSLVQAMLMVMVWMISIYLRLIDRLDRLS